jgi:hypothetical protein
MTATAVRWLGLVILPLTLAVKSETVHRQVASEFDAVNVRFHQLHQ